MVDTDSSHSLRNDRLISPSNALITFGREKPPVQEPREDLDWVAAQPWKACSPPPSTRKRSKDLICFLLIGYQLIIINTWLLYVPLFHLLKILVQESPPVARRVATVDRTPCSARGDSLLSMIFDWENLKKSGCHCQPFSLIKWRWRTKMTIMRYATK